MAQSESETFMVFFIEKNKTLQRCAVNRALNASPKRESFLVSSRDNLIDSLGDAAVLANPNASC